MAGTQNYASTPRLGSAAISAANPNRDGSGTTVNVFSAGASGSRIDSIIIQATAATSLGMVRLFVFDGTNARLIGEIPVTLTTPGPNTPAFSAQLTTANLSNLLPLILPANHVLRASTEKGEAFNVIAIGGDF